MAGITPTKEQQAVIDCPSSLVAIAKPGSGKTFVMAQKIRAIVPTLKEYQGVIAISYTNKASNELRKRVKQDGFEVKRSFFGTIDRFCDLEIILPFLSHLLGHAREEMAIVRIRDLDDAEREQLKDIKENSVSLQTLEAHLDVVRSLFRNGKVLLEMNGALALYTVRNSPACRRYLKAKYTHIFVDEYQDSGLEQHELFLAIQELGLIAIAVGDADQSIFGFSGKDSRYLTALGQTKAFKVFPITFNHRCHPSIINYSLRLLDENSHLLDADGPHVYLAVIDGTQADIAGWIDQNLAAICSQFDVTKASEVAILARAGYSGAIVDEALRTKHRLFVTHPLEEEFAIWAKLFARLLNYYYDEKLTAQEVIDEFGSHLLTAQEIRSCRTALREFRKKDPPGVDDFVTIAKMISPQAESRSAITLLTESLRDPNLTASFAEPADDEVQIMSIHKSKGLEFDIVFHLDLYEWLLPSKMPGPNNDFKNPIFSNMSEDTHLHYVGITRARKSCILCTSTRRLNRDRQSKMGSFSEFLAMERLISLRRPIGAILNPR